MRRCGGDVRRPPAVVAAMLVFYDGHCGLCHGAVKFLLRRDRDGSRFRFAPLQGTTLAERVPAERRAGLPDSVVVLDESEALLTRSDGVVAILDRLGGAWRWLGRLLAVVPRPVRDGAYDFVARIRKHFFASPTETCPLTPPELRSRFDP